MGTGAELGRLSEEFAEVQLGDKRRAKRLGILLDSAVKTPGESLPVQAGNPGALEATYRFLGNEQIDPMHVLRAHLQRTAERAKATAEILVVHDTTQFMFQGEGLREGLGTVQGSDQGFLAHYSMALGPQGRPLGLVALRAWTRKGPPKGRRGPRKLQLDEDRESLRWHEAVEEVVERLGEDVPAIHVMDREGDSYELFSHLLEMNQRFVIRLAHDRNVGLRRPGDRGGLKLFAAMEAAPLLLEREVHLSKRTGKNKSPREKRLHPPRKIRIARLVVRATDVFLARSQHQPLHLPENMRLNFIEVNEPDPPEGTQAVCWRLVTTEPITSAEDVARVIDIYRQRWQIEEYFKALKTGCAFEKRQLESAKTLVMGLVIFSVVAWRLLLLRWMERHEEKAPATAALTPRQLDVLRAVTPRHLNLSDQPTCREVLLAIAALGAHLPSNGPPGWQVLGRGLDKLFILEQGWAAARDGPYPLKSDR